MGDIITIICLALVVVTALWKENAVTFMASAGFFLMAGLNAPDMISGSAETTSMGISVGLIFIAMSLLCSGWAFRLMFGSD